MQRSDNSRLTDADLIANYQATRSPDLFHLLYERYTDKVCQRYGILKKNLKKPNAKS